MAECPSEEAVLWLQDARYYGALVFWTCHNLQMLNSSHFMHVSSAVNMHRVSSPLSLSRHGCYRRLRSERHIIAPRHAEAPCALVTVMARLLAGCDVE